MGTSISRQRLIKTEGAVGTTRAEIHRMKVRYSHLCKTHEKLTGDLEIRVSMRDTIAVQTYLGSGKPVRAATTLAITFRRNWMIFTSRSNK
jgi:hypothetical protein